MREIKFRAWDKEQKRMLVPAMPTLGGGMTWREGSYDSSSENYALMQFTGLKDKNGKEIYEGDILLIDDIERHIVGWENSVLSFYQACAGYDTEGWNSAEVIGNIYENPELLEVKRG